MTTVAVWCATALALLGHGFVWTGVVNRLHGWGGPHRVVKSLTFVAFIAFLLLPAFVAAEAMRAPRGFNPFAAGGWGAPYAWACAAIGAASLVVKPWIERQRHDRRALVAWTREPRDASIALVASPLHGAFARLLGCVPGNEATSLTVDRKRLAIPRLPVELEGLTIAHISDLHMCGRVGAEYFAGMAQLVNDLRPDVVAVTGDIVEQEACRPWLADSLERLCAPLGVYFILGNHDAFIDVGRTRAQLSDAGLTCLSGRWVRADFNGASVLLGGNELPWLRPAPRVDDLPARRAGAAEFRIALCHSPDQFDWCCRADVDLALAGHTHGGQVQLPVLGVIGSPSLYGTRYACGVFRRGATVLHVTRGVSGLTPLRWRCPPEIALLELTRGGQ